MTEPQVLQLVKFGLLPGGETCQELIETHISWVLLGHDFVYKIKKPLKLSFLDFSTLEKRRHSCEQEVMLNQRLTQNVYLKVVGIRYHQGLFSLESDQGLIVDYAVVMKRLDNSREMSKLLKAGKVGVVDMKKIAHQLVQFHQNAQVIKGVLTPELIKEDFNDIQQIIPFVQENMGSQASNKLEQVISFSDAYIDSKSDLIIDRDQQGFTRDCHGDLHSGNIFLLQEPVIFDCIEFNQHLRTIDIFGELGFFCMDLEFYHRGDLSDLFIEFYNQSFPIIRNEREQQLFVYYKMYRANVKVKINAIKTQQAHSEEEKRLRLNLFQRYLVLMEDYHTLLSSTFPNDII
jgi:aminoglycoside phosphotransferase family enzyme